VKQKWNRLPTECMGGQSHSQPPINSSRQPAKTHQLDRPRSCAVELLVLILKQIDPVDLQEHLAQHLNSFVRTGRGGAAGIVVYRNRQNEVAARFLNAIDDPVRNEVDSTAIFAYILKVVTERRVIELAAARVAAPANLIGIQLPGLVSDESSFRRNRGSFSESDEVVDTLFNDLTVDLLIVVGSRRRRGGRNGNGVRAAARRLFR